MKRVYNDAEHRSFVRLNYIKPLLLKLCKKKTVFNLLDGYTSNISKAGLLCSIKEKVRINDILWLSFDRGTLNFCQELERKALVYQSGIMGKVVRVIHQGKNDYSVGIQFITREEKSHSNIYPKIYFLEQQQNEKTA